jgi:hypothetical protein
MKGLSLKNTHRTASLLVTTLLAGCSSFLNPSHSIDDISPKRNPEQSYYEDSLTVFFFDYPNPYPDKEVLWFAAFMEGSVEMRVHDMENDSLVAVYRFVPQESPVYPIAYRADDSLPVKCVIHVNNRPKCARQMPWLYPLAVPQWGTEYTVEEMR